jgi:outer membrane protein OmpA-like peptidoglycan-associated protein
MTRMRPLAIKTFLSALLLLSAGQSIHPAFWKNDGKTRLTLDAMERLTPNLTEAPVTFTILTGDPETGDLFPVDETELNGISSWQLQILDRTGRKVSFIQGRDKPSSIIIPWPGFSDSGEPLPDGFYTARFIWLDSAGKGHSTDKTSVTLFTPLSIKNLADRKLKLTYTDEGLVVGIAEGMIFRPGQTAILDGSLPALREIARFLVSYSKNRVIIRGYTDSSGSSERNVFLSRERAAVVRQYLVNAGIDPGRLTYEGRGSSKPVASNATEAGRSRNRRVEVVVSKTTL